MAGETTDKRKRRLEEAATMNGDQPCQRFYDHWTPERIRALIAERDRWRTFALMAGVTELDNGNVMIPDDEGLGRTRRWWWPW